MAKKEPKKALTKTQLISHLADKTEIPKKKVVELMGRARTPRTRPRS